MGTVDDRAGIGSRSHLDGIAWPHGIGGFLNRAKRLGLGAGVGVCPIRGDVVGGGMRAQTTPENHERGKHEKSAEFMQCLVSSVPPGGSCGAVEGTLSEPWVWLCFGHGIQGRLTLALIAPAPRFGSRPSSLYVSADKKKP